VKADKRNMFCPVGNGFADTVTEKDHQLENILEALENI
jgi:hypothetical protein